MNGFVRSWGGYPDYPQHAHLPAWRSDVAYILDTVCRAEESILPYGNGRSYGDSCLALSGHVVGLRHLDRFLGVDWVGGAVKVEAGVSLSEIIALALPKGWFLAVTPGTQFATVGGAIANDVHGKNHHVRGTFGCHVLQFALYRKGEVMVCSREENAELFAATVGGLGLTGVILWAELQLISVRSRHIEGTVERFGGLAEFFELSAELDPQHEYSVAWIDCLATGSQAGRGVFMVGDHARDDDLQPHPRIKISVPVTPPMSLINGASLRAFNEVYWRVHPKRRTAQCVDYEPFFYPLDRILHWNRIYGRKGFQQYQCVVPEQNADSAIRELLSSIAAAGQGSFLAVLKRCGDVVSPGLLSFPLPGTSLALDFPQSPVLLSLFARLDAIVRAAGGRLYPAKDAHMSARDFQAAYPAWEQLESLRDPSLMSRFWKRVTS